LSFEVGEKEAVEMYFNFTFGLFAYPEWQGHYCQCTRAERRKENEEIEIEEKVGEAPKSKQFACRVLNIERHANSISNSVRHVY
jgi:hypothetical protein